MKKLSAILLTVVMLFAVCLPVFAVGTNSITVKNTTAGAEYNIYKMLDLSVSDGLDAYSYTVNSNWTGFFATGGAGASYVTIDDQGYVTWTNAAADTQAFAQAAAKYAKDNSIATAQTAQTSTANGANVTFNNLESGYYLVTSSLGNKAIVDTTPANPAVEVEEKNSTPTLDKTVQENSTGNFGKVNDAGIGDTVNFKVDITVAANAEGYVMHDTMSTGLAWTGAENVTVKIGDNVVNATETDGTVNYTVTAGTETGEGTTLCTFEVAFTDAYIGTVAAGTVITVTYSATVTADAVIAGEGNPNTAVLDYKEDNAVKSTTPSTTTTYVWNFNVFKYTVKTENPETPLAGAKFKLYKTVQENGADVTYYATFKDKVVDTQTVKQLSSWVKDINSATELVTPYDGTIAVQGLDAGVYALTETEAPAGYNTLAADQPVVIKANENYAAPTASLTHSVYDSETATTALANDTVKVENKTGSLLPSTGGIGTTIFYVIGGLLVVGAAIFLIVRKRMSADGKAAQ